MAVDGFDVKGKYLSGAFLPLSSPLLFSCHFFYIVTYGATNNCSPRLLLFAGIISADVASIMKNHVGDAVMVRVVRHNLSSLPQLSSRTSARDSELLSLPGPRLLAASVDGSPLPPNTFECDVPLTRAGLGINVQHIDNGSADGHGLFIHRFQNSIVLVEYS